MAGDDGVAVDLLNGRDGVTAWADLGDESAASVRFTRFGVTFDQNDASTALTLAARTPTERSPSSALAVLDVEKRYVRTGDVASASIRFSLAPGGLPADATLSDVVLLQRRTGDWRRVSTSRNGRNFSATVSDLSSVVVAVDRDDPNTSESNAGNAPPADTGQDDSGETTDSSVQTPHTRTTADTTPTDRTSPTPATQTVRSDGQLGFGFLVAVAAFVVLVHKRQRL